MPDYNPLEFNMLPNTEIRVFLLPEKSISFKQALIDLAQIRRQRRISKGRALKLAPYEEDILVLRKIGDSERGIQVWLDKEQHVKVHQTTVHRFLKHNRR